MKPNQFFAGAIFLVGLLNTTIFLPLVSNQQNGTLPPLPTITATPTATATLVIPTAEPTIAATPTEVAPTATATPTATPIQLPPSNVVVLDNHSTRLTSIDSFYIVGEVQNNTDSNVRFVRITADVFNGDGQLIDTTNTYARAEVLAPGQKSCFNVIFLDEPAGWASYQLHVEYDTTTEQVRPLSVSSVTSGSNILGFELLGLVHNNGAEPLDFVKVIGTLYDSNDKVTFCNTTYSNAETLNPGASSSWKMSFVGSEPSEVARYTVVAD